MPIEKLPNWRRLDLNLLVVFHAVIEERSATAAANKLNMSQPAVSHALSRLRNAMEDELFVRTPDGLEPTPFALNLAKGVASALEQLRFTLEGAENFAPAISTREFALAVNNHAALVLAPPLTAAISSEAPGIRLNLRPSGTLDLADELDQGHIDLAISQHSATADRFHDLKLFDEDFSAIVRADHPALAGRDKLTLELVASLPHLVISSTGESTDFVDTALARKGLSRRIALRAPLLATNGILLQSDMIAITGTRAADAFARTAPLRVLRLPFASPTFPIALLWHRRFDDLPAHKWLRGMVGKVAKSLRK